MLQRHLRAPPRRREDQKCPADFSAYEARPGGGQRIDGDNDRFATAAGGGLKGRH